MITLAINGFGRIGRTFLRVLFSDVDMQKKVKVAVINIGPATIAYVAHMFKYDTLMGTFSGSIVLEGDDLIINGMCIKIVSITDSARLAWQAYSIDWVVDCSGRFTHRIDAQKHITAGAKKVLISSPGHDMDCSVIVGINDQAYDSKKHSIVSLGSCTTNAFIPLLHVLDKAYRVESGFMQTVHAYTNSQVLLDVESKDLRCSRAAALNIIPTTTGASAMLRHIMPHLEDKIAGMALRVPVGKVSLVDLVVQVKNKAVNADQVNLLFKNTADSTLKNILSLSYDPLVSSDFAGDPHSVIVDTMMTQVIDNMIHMYGWYDNEWGYSMRIKDFLLRKN